MAAKQQTTEANPVADAEAVVARLQERHQQLTAERATAVNRVAAHAYDAHALADDAPDGFVIFGLRGEERELAYEHGP